MPFSYQVKVEVGHWCLVACGYAATHAAPVRAVALVIGFWIQEIFRNGRFAPQHSQHRPGILYRPSVCTPARRQVLPFFVPIGEDEVLPSSLEIESAITTAHTRSHYEFFLTGSSINARCSDCDKTILRFEGPTTVIDITLGIKRGDDLLHFYRSFEDRRTREEVGEANDVCEVCFGCLAFRAEMLL